jgi:hypothetical protein
MSPLLVKLANYIHITTVASFQNKKALEIMFEFANLLIKTDEINCGKLNNTVFSKLACDPYN